MESLVKKEIELPDIIMYYTDSGGTKEPVLLVHGFPLSSEIWQKLIPLLKTDYRIIAPDLRGHGLTDAPMIEYSLEQMADDLFNLLNKLKIEKVHFVGHSMGGYIALAFLEKYPEKLLSITMLHSTTYADTEEGLKGREQTIKTIENEGLAKYAENMANKLFAQDFALANPEEVAEIAKIINTTSLRAVIQTIKAIMKRPCRTNRLAEANIPVLFLMGAEDSLIPSARILPLQEMLPKANFRIMAKVGHMGMIEEPVEVARILREFW